MEWIRNKVITELCPRIHEFNKFQNATGAIARSLDKAEYLLDEITALSAEILDALKQSDYAVQLNKDLGEWKRIGLNNAPCFKRSLESYVPPIDGGQTFYLASIITPNSHKEKGYWLECFFAQRKEPDVLLPIMADLPHPQNVSQTMQLIASSSGFSVGHCLVFFPENVKTRNKVDKQHFEMFFFNKFHAIYQKDTLRRVGSLFDFQGQTSQLLSAENCYAARTVWGYLHDYYHHCGPRPFNKNIQVKMNFWVGVLEEIKVDCLTILRVQKHHYTWWREVTEFILFERLARYPAQHDATSNFDAATGVLLFSWLKRRGHGISISNHTGKVLLNLEKCLIGLNILVQEIEELESIEDNATYKQAVENYVMQELQPGNDNERYNIPDDYLIHKKNMNVSVPVLFF
ncbi:DUF6421 family protein [Pantoea sp. S18]|uniref:DUF6421 family protein n=1 Tax=Pantoea sp. S18 TaxID=3019892 RepID=UPI002B21A886|nr:DUF6421 family protein [Pantoea sp. S18]MEA5100863.1 DUF6421 family protein [Pantoea sp. S18]